MRGNLELDVLLGGDDGADGHVVAGAQGVDHLVHQLLGGRGAGGEADGAHASRARQSISAAVSMSWA
jgi:hypothetical protein